MQPNKAKYTTQACDFCKQRHLRCNGQVPCQQCQKRNQNCQFTQVNYKRGPKPKPRDSKFSKSREWSKEEAQEMPPHLFQVFNPSIQLEPEEQLTGRGLALETKREMVGEVDNANYSEDPNFYRTEVRNSSEECLPVGPESPVGGRQNYPSSPSSDPRAPLPQPRNHIHPSYIHTVPQPRYHFLSLSTPGSLTSRAVPVRNDLDGAKDNFSPDTPNNMSAHAQHPPSEYLHTGYHRYPTQQAAREEEIREASDASLIYQTPRSEKNDTFIDQNGGWNEVQNEQVPLKALFAFMKHIHPLCPNNFIISGKEAKPMWEDLIQIAAGSLKYSRLEQWVSGFVYAVVFSNVPGSYQEEGCRICQRPREADMLAEAAGAIMAQLFFSKEKLDPIYYAPYADQLVSCMTLYGSYLMESADFNSARLCFSQAYNIHNIHVNQISPSVSHRLYAYLAGMSRGTPDMSHWVLDAHLLGPAANTSVNRVVLCCLYCSPSMLRDPHNKPLPTGLFIPTSQDLIPYDDSVLYREMLDEVNETIDLVRQCETSSSPDPPDYILAYNAIIYGCRAYVMAHCGMSKPAGESAAKAVQFASCLGDRVLFWAIPIALSYSLQVSRVLTDEETFSTGYKVLLEFARYYPFVQRIIPILDGMLAENSVPTDPTTTQPPSFPFHPPTNQNTQSLQQQFYGQQSQPTQSPLTPLSAPPHAHSHPQPPQSPQFYQYPQPNSYPGGSNPHHNGPYSGQPQVPASQHYNYFSYK